MVSFERISALGFVAAALALPTPSYAEDNPNANIEAQTAKVVAETARINAEAALLTAKAAKDKASIEGLGLPKFDNKTTLEKGGGAIETSMLATYAVSAAGEVIGSAISATDCPANPDKPTIVVLAGKETYDLNAGKIMLARMSYLEYYLDSAVAISAQPARGAAAALVSPMLVSAAISAAAGLLGNETTVTGIDLAEVDDQMLAKSVAGHLKKCAMLPSAGNTIADIDHSAIAAKLGDLTGKRAAAVLSLGHIPEKPSSNQKARAEALKSAIEAFDAFYKEIGTPETGGQTPFIMAVLSEDLAGRTLKFLRVAVNKAGGTITSSKNISTFVGVDPVRVSGGLVASYALIDSKSGAVVSAGSFACQTTRVRLGKVQSGHWWATKSGTAPTSRDKFQTSFCKGNQ